MIHTVTFSLKHSPGSAEEADFLAAAGDLAVLPGVKDFAIWKQTSVKNPHAHGITMRFDSESDFQSYCEHPLHVAFVETRWLPEVTDFREADFA